MQTVVPFACFLSMIRPPGVQFENSLLQIAPVDKAKCPYVKDHNDIAFQLYTRHNPTTYQELVINDDERLFASHIDWHDNTVIYFHAFMEMPDEGSGLMVREAYILRGDTNVIMVDAQRLEAGPWYFTAAENTWYIGQFAAQFIDYLVSRGLDLSRTHLIGHSLGAQAAGVAGTAIKSGKVSRITGLDPALPLFHGLPLEQQLDTSDAHFVDVIHTDGGIFGVHRPVGHADFYPNGGISPQPGCELEVVIPQKLLLNNCNRIAPEGLYTFYLKPNPTHKDARFKLERRIEKLFSYLQFTKADIGKRKVHKTGSMRTESSDGNNKSNVQIDLRDIQDKVENPNVENTEIDNTNIKVENPEETHITKVTEKYENAQKTEKELFNDKSYTDMKETYNTKKAEHRHDWVMIEDQIMTDSILQPYVIKPWFYVPNYAKNNEQTEERKEINVNESKLLQESLALIKKIDTESQTKVNHELVEPSPKSYDHVETPRKLNFGPLVQSIKLNYDPPEPSTKLHQTNEPSTKLLYETNVPYTKLNYKLSEPFTKQIDEPNEPPTKLNYELIKLTTETSYEPIKPTTEPSNDQIEPITEQNYEPQKSHVVKRQKRFINFFKHSEAEEHNNFLFKMLDFLLKNRKNALPVYTVMREINTLVKSANGELNHSTKERNNFIGAPPPSVIPLTYNLEIGNENRIVAFMKKLVGLTPKGDRLVISG